MRSVEVALIFSQTRAYIDLRDTEEEGLLIQIAMGMKETGLGHLVGPDNGY